MRKMRKRKKKKDSGNDGRADGNKGRDTSAFTWADPINGADQKNGGNGPDFRMRSIEIMKGIQCA